MDKIAFEMRADERSLTRLGQALDFAVEDDILNLCDKVGRLKELALAGIED